MPAGSQQNSFSVASPTQWAGNDPQAAMTWVKSLGDGEAKDHALAGMVSGWAQNSPRDAANYAATLPPGKTQDGIAQSVVSAWASAEPEEAAKWAAMFPEGEAPGKAVRSVVNTWLNNDPEGAGKWARNFAGRQTARASSRGLTSAKSRIRIRSSPRPGWNSIANGNTAGTRWKNLARNWMRVDPTPPEPGFPTRVYQTAQAALAATESGVELKMGLCRANRCLTRVLQYRLAGTL